MLHSLAVWPAQCCTGEDLRTEKVMRLRYSGMLTGRGELETTNEHPVPVPFCLPLTDAFKPVSKCLSYAMVTSTRTLIMVEWSPFMFLQEAGHRLGLPYTTG
jgi:hypothetical protein